MYFVYVLISEKDNQFYTGYTSDLENRLKEHNSGSVYSTKNRLPLRLVYFEGSLNQ
jgi:putative endonuclease